ncbi:leucine-rich repeats and immunoglobulin-like domains protein 3 [Lytechinus variegatus]|uniref:leucine-rich repeats and immunoglobulin-like domains protein 3 n=1 Tax=Lytechinus variegatus TaxID=7654 RepID=UPI001BB1FEE8|nr:leucine-rich repeats and immunoglobulin-like domains protein 3 [Lytechinus variegatus]
MATDSSQIFRCFYTVLVVYCLVLDNSKYVSAQNVLCPEECWCLGSLVDCSKRHLTSLPTDLPTWVTMLELQSNRIASIPDGAFDRLSQLEDLDLSSNKLRRLNMSIFDGLSNLQQLKLASNKLTSVPILGPSARNLTQLILHHNRITNISPAALRGLTSLRTLDLSYNRIGHLRTDTFPTDNRLQFLLLENNRIGTLQQGCLNNLRSLEILKLNRNHIESLPRDLFTHLESLNLLELSRNELTTVDSLVFSGLESLEELSLSRNQLTDLMDGAFYGLNAIQQLELDGNELTTISRRWLFGLKSLLHLTVAHNRINETEASGWEFCPNLEYLDLSHNRLTTLETEGETVGESGGPAAQGTNGGAAGSVGVPPWPPLLRELYINHNRITQVADGAFIQLNLLQVLDLSDNVIAWTVEDMTGAFEGLESLLRLGLANNNINSIARRAFNGLTNLQSLDFAGNAITTVENNAFEGMPQLNQLLVNSSSMVCDCQMAWFPVWVKENNLGEGVDGRCAHPDSLQGMDIFSVDPEVFTCDDRLKPFIIREPETTVSLKNDNVSLICTAGSTSDVPVTLLWKKDKAIMEDANPIYFERLNPNGVNEYTSVLSLSHIKEENQGRYQCIISNEFGVTYSKKARVTVHIFPSFTVTPSHVSVRVGGIAELPCAATGHPTPKIAWQKDGGINFPAARQRRIKVKTELAEFYIDNVQMSDTGVYTCTALNAAGTISTNATLTVLEPPLFTSQMKDLTIEVGEPAVMECNVEGSPRPSIRWFKDDEPFTLSDGMHLTDFDRYLIIMNAAGRDGGRYTCEATNSLGIRTDSAKLVVTKKSGTIWNMTTTSIIIVVVICCILGTSLIWVVIIYHTRKRTRRYRVEESSHHIVPPEIPSSTLNGSSEGTIHQETSSGVSSAATDKYQDDNASDCDSLDGPVNKLSTFRFANQVRMAAIFPSETKVIEPPEIAPCPPHHCSIQDGPHRNGMEGYCPSDSISEADRTTLERRGQLSALPCCNATGRSLDSAINKHMYLHHGVGGRLHPSRKGGSDGEEGEIEEEDDEDVFMDEATRDRLQRERLLTNSDEGLGSQTASPVNRHSYRRSNHPPPQCCHSYTSMSSPEGRCTSPSSFNLPHENAQKGDAYSRMAMSSSSLPCNGRIPNVHLYENPTSSVQDRDLINGHLCRSHNHVNNVNVNNNGNTNHSPVADPIRQSHSIPTAISSKGNISPGIGALLSPTTHQPQVQNGHLHSHHRPHLPNRHNDKPTHRKSGRHPEKHHLKSKTSPKSGQSIPRTSYLPSSNTHPAHHVTSPTLTSLTEA